VCNYYSSFPFLKLTAATTLKSAAEKPHRFATVSCSSNLVQISESLEEHCCRRAAKDNGSADTPEEKNEVHFSWRTRIRVRVRG
jgi:hypothetical protein